MGQRIAPRDVERASRVIGQRVHAFADQTAAVVAEATRELMARIQAGKVRGEDPRPAMLAYLQENVLDALKQGDVEQAIKALSDGFFNQAVPYFDYPNGKVIKHNIIKDVVETQTWEAGKSNVYVSLAEMLEARVRINAEQAQDDLDNGMDDEGKPEPRTAAAALVPTTAQTNGKGNGIAHTATATTSLNGVGKHVEPARHHEYARIIVSAIEGDMQDMEFYMVGCVMDGMSDIAILKRIGCTDLNDTVTAKMLELLAKVRANLKDERSM